MVVLLTMSGRQVALLLEVLGKFLVILTAFLAAVVGVTQFFVPYVIRSVRQHLRTLQT